MIIEMSNHQTSILYSWELPSAKHDLPPTLTLVQINAIAPPHVGHLPLQTIIYMHLTLDYMVIDTYTYVWTLVQLQIQISTNFYCSYIRCYPCFCKQTPFNPLTPPQLPTLFIFNRNLLVCFVSYPLLNPSPYCPPAPFRGCWNFIISCLFTADVHIQLLLGLMDWTHGLDWWTDFAPGRPRLFSAIDPSGRHSWLSLCTSPQSTLLSNSGQKFSQVSYQ